MQETMIQAASQNKVELEAINYYGERDSIVDHADTLDPEDISKRIRNLVSTAEGAEAYRTLPDTIRGAVCDEAFCRLMTFPRTQYDKLDRETVELPEYIRVLLAEIASDGSGEAFINGDNDYQNHLRDVRALEPLCDQFCNKPEFKPYFDRAPADYSNFLSLFIDAHDHYRKAKTFVFG